MNLMRQSIIAGVLAIVAGAAIGNASPIALTLTEISSTEVIVTGTGDLSGFAIPFSNGALLGLSDPFGNSQPGTYENAPVLQASTLALNGLPVDFAYTLGSGFPDFFPDGSGPGIYFGNSVGYSFSAGGSFTGSMDLVLTDGSTFAVGGSTGDVYWGTGAFGPGRLVGTYTIVDQQSVPDGGATVAMLGTGIIGLVALRRKASRDGRAL